MKNQLIFKSEQGKNAILAVYDSVLARWPVPYEALNITTHYGDTFIIACGEKSAPPLILMHGSTANSVFWMGDIPEYSRHYRVYAIDIPGEPGKSQAIRHELTSLAYVQWLEELFVALNIEKACMIGISLGAWMMLKFAAAHPERVVKLALLCPSGIGPQKMSFAFKTIPLLCLGEWGLNQLIRIVNGNQPVYEEAVRYTKLIGENFNPRVEVMPILSDEELKRLTMTLLVIVGEKDALLHSKKTAARLQKILPHGMVKMLPGVGHVLINQTDQILSFLNPIS